MTPPFDICARCGSIWHGTSKCSGNSTLLLKTLARENGLRRRISDALPKLNADQLSKLVQVLEEITA